MKTKWHEWKGGNNAVDLWYWRPSPGGSPDSWHIVTALWSPERRTYYTDEMPRRWCHEMGGLWQRVPSPRP